MSLYHIDPRPLKDQVIYFYICEKVDLEYPYFYKSILRARYTTKDYLRLCRVPFLLLEDGVNVLNQFTNNIVNRQIFLFPDGEVGENRIGFFETDQSPTEMLCVKDEDGSV